MNKSGYFIFITASLLLLAHVLSIAQETFPAEKEDPDVIALLKNIEESQADIKTITGTFTQLKSSTVFKEDILSEGRFWVKFPDKFRCEFTRDNKINININGDVLWIYLPEINQAEKVNLHIDKGTDTVIKKTILGLGKSIDFILKNFTVEYRYRDEENPNIVSILLKKKEDSKEPDYFSTIQMWIDTEKLLPKRVLVFESNDIKTRYDLKEVSFNEEIPDDLFVPKFSLNVEIIERN